MFYYSSDSSLDDDKSKKPKKQHVDDGETEFYYAPTITEPIDFSTTLYGPQLAQLETDVSNLVDNTDYVTIASILHNGDYPLINQQEIRYSESGPHYTDFFFTTDQKLLTFAILTTVRDVNIATQWIARPDISNNHDKLWTTPDRVTDLGNGTYIVYVYPNHTTERLCLDNAGTFGYFWHMGSSNEFELTTDDNILLENAYGNPTFPNQEPDVNHILSPNLLKDYSNLQSCSVFNMFQSQRRNIVSTSKMSNTNPMADSLAICSLEPYEESTIVNLNETHESNLGLLRNTAHDYLNLTTRFILKYSVATYKKANEWPKMPVLVFKLIYTKNNKTFEDNKTTFQLIRRKRSVQENVTKEIEFNPHNGVYGQTQIADDVYETDNIYLSIGCPEFAYPLDTTIEQETLAEIQFNIDIHRTNNFKIERIYTTVPTNTKDNLILRRIPYDETKEVFATVNYISQGIYSYTTENEIPELTARLIQPTPWTNKLGYTIRQSDIFRKWKTNTFVPWFYSTSKHWEPMSLTSEARLQTNEEEEPGNLYWLQQYYPSPGCSSLLRLFSPSELRYDTQFTLEKNNIGHIIWSDNPLITDSDYYYGVA